MRLCKIQPPQQYRLVRAFESRSFVRPRIRPAVPYKASTSVKVSETCALVKKCILQKMRSCAPLLQKKLNKTFFASKGNITLIPNIMLFGQFMRGHKARVINEPFIEIVKMIYDVGEVSKNTTRNKLILICILGSALGQYSSSSEEAGLPKKSPAIRRYKSQPPQHQSNSRFSNSAPQTSVANQRFRRPITVNKARPTSEPIPELPVFTSGIRGSHPPRLTPISVSTSPVPLSSYEQNDEAASLPIQTIQQPHLVHAQSIHSPQAASAFNELKPVNEEHDKDEDVVQVIANLGAVSGNAFTGNLLSPTIASPTPTLTAYLQAQHQQQLQQLQQQHNQHPQQSLPPAPQYRPIQRPQPQSTPAEPQYKPQKPIRLQKQPQQQQQHHHQVQQQHHHQVQQQQQQQQHREHQHHHQQQPQQQQLTSRNEYDFNENSRPVISKPRPTAVPKKSKPQEYYGEGGRTKKPVAQVSYWIAITIASSLKCSVRD
ncbi:unnamed protein product [Trichogramma brassicae]|uniref:Uncharacterized protein n=1 Tax=Trichogramma brassicae TaxID=86971 RepID=A0A6H5IGA5_9HYME|nr:unnamed protein product [Trichogramma brassicae]